MEYEEILEKLWPLIAPEFKWAAVDEDLGSVDFYKSKPRNTHPVFNPSYWDNDEDYCSIDIELLDIDTTKINWQESLVERPEGV